MNIALEILSSLIRVTRFRLDVCKCSFSNRADHNWNCLFALHLVLILAEHVQATCTVYAELEPGGHILKTS